MSAVPQRTFRIERESDYEVDLQQAENFIKLLAEGERVTFQTFDDNDSRKDPSLALILHGDLAQHGQRLGQLNRAGAGVFMAINRMDGGGAGQKT